MTTPRITPHEGDRQDADNHPHLSFYDLDTRQSFVWSGDFDRAVQVCAGGAGEPITGRFTLTGSRELRQAMRTGRLASVVEAFGIECLLWIAQQPEEDS